MGRGKSKDVLCSVLKYLKKNVLIELAKVCEELPFDRSTLYRYFRVFVDAGWLIELPREGNRIFYLRFNNSPQQLFDQLEKEEKGEQE